MNSTRDPLYNLAKFARRLKFINLTIVGRKGRYNVYTR